MKLFAVRPSAALTLLGALVATFAIAVAGCAQSGPPAAPPLTADRAAAIVASPDRSAADRQNDLRRKPVEMLTFVGVRSGMTALDVSAGGGYTTELVARAVGPTGLVYGQSAPPKPDRAPPATPEGGDGTPRGAGNAAATVAPAAPRRTSAMAIAERASRVDGATVARMVPVEAPFEDPLPSSLAPGSLDLVTLMFNYHDFGYLGVDRAAMNARLFAALKPGGLYVIADHAGRPGTGISESGTLHRVEEAFVVREVEAAGFRLVARGDFLANPADPRNRNTPDPPMPKDEFVLKFVK